MVKCGRGGKVCERMCAVASVPAEIVGFAGEQFPLEIDVAEDGAPEGFILFEIEHVGHERADDPRVLAEFFFELAASPAGVTKKSTQVHPVFRLEFQGFLRIDAKHQLKARALGIKTPGTEQEPVGVYRTALEDRDGRERTEGEFGVELSEAFAERTIQNDPHCAFVVVRRQQHDGSAKIVILERRMREEEGSCEGGGI